MDTTGIALLNYQILDIPPVKDPKIIPTLLRIGLEQSGFNNRHTFLVDFRPMAKDAIIFVAKLVRE